MLKSSQKLVYQGVVNRTSAAGKPFTLVKLADPVKFESYDFFKQDQLNLDGLNEGDYVFGTFGLSKNGFKTNIDLLALHKA